MIRKQNAFEEDFFLPFTFYSRLFSYTLFSQEGFQVNKNIDTPKIISCENTILAPIYRCRTGATFRQVSEKFGGSKALHEKNFYPILDLLVDFLKSKIKIPDRVEFEKDKQWLIENNFTFPSVIAFADCIDRGFATKNSQFRTFKKNCKGRGIRSLEVIRRVNGKRIYTTDGHRPGTTAGTEKNILLMSDLKNIFENQLNGFKIGYDSGLMNLAESPFILAMPKIKDFAKITDERFRRQIKLLQKERSDIERVFGVTATCFQILKKDWNGRGKNLDKVVLRAGQVHKFCAIMMNLKFEIDNLALHTKKDHIAIKKRTYTARKEALMKKMQSE